MQRRTTSRRHVLAVLVCGITLSLTQTHAFLMPPPGVAVRRAGTRMPQGSSSSSTTLQASSSAAVMDAPSPTITATGTSSSSTARRVRRRSSAAASAASTSSPSSSSSSSLTQQQQQPQLQPQPSQQQLRPSSSSRSSVSRSSSSQPITTSEHDTLMHARVKAVQRAALAIQKQRSLAKELGRPPSPSEWATALGGVTEEGLRRVLEQGTVARAALVKGWDGLVAKFVGKYAQSLSDSELQDLAVEGQLGVVEAAVRFQGGQGAGFKTYVYYWVRKRVMDAAAVYDRSTYGGVHEARQASLIKKAVEAHERESGGKVMTAPEIALKVGLPVERVEELSRRGQRYGLLGGRAGGAGVGNGATGLRFLDTLQDKEGVGGGGQGGVLESMYLAEVEEAVRGALMALPREERMVLNYRLGLEDGQPKGWEEMGQVMEGCSLSYLRKVEAKAKIQLRRNVEVVKLIHRRPSSFDEAFLASE